MEPQTPFSSKTKYLLYRLANFIFVGGGMENIGESEDVSIPNNIDLMALPQLCFPGIWFRFCVTKSFAVVTETRNVVTKVLGAKLVIMWCIYFIIILFFLLIRWAPDKQWTESWTVPLPGFHWRLWQQDPWSSNAVSSTNTGTQYCIFIYTYLAVLRPLSKPALGSWQVIQQDNKIFECML